MEDEIDKFRQLQQQTQREQEERKHELHKVHTHPSCLIHIREIDIYSTVQRCIRNEENRSEMEGS